MMKIPKSVMEIPFSAMELVLSAMEVPFSMTQLVKSVTEVPFSTTSLVTKQDTVLKSVAAIPVFGAKLSSRIHADDSFKEFVPTR
jgi:hypothetical protein